jgi:maltose-binding protein MalE
VLTDPAVQEKFRWYPAVSAALDAAEPLPNLPEFNEAAEIATRRMVQGIVEERDIKEALDIGASEVTDLLSRRGYYQ